MIEMAIAGACGAVARYLIELLGINSKARTSPWLTMLANVLGSFLVGFVLHSLAIADGVQAKTSVVVGFCAGLTTFSSAFAVPMLFDRRNRKYGYLLLLLTPLLCAGAFVLGIQLSK